MHITTDVVKYSHRLRCQTNRASQMPTAPHASQRPRNHFHRRFISMAYPTVVSGGPCDREDPSDTVENRIDDPMRQRSTAPTFRRAAKLRVRLLH
jgi:hypothetical protein